MLMTEADYLNLYRSCLLTTDATELKILDHVTYVAILHQDMYKSVELSTKNLFQVAVPWPIIAAIHYRESDQNFKCHLHNGDPLTARTVHAPIGRPKTGQPPFTWEKSALDAFIGEWAPDDWDLPSCLEFLERWNGTGYQRHGVNTPYLWDYTNHYMSGLFVADGHFDPDKKESRPGCVAFLKTLEAKGVSLDFIRPHLTDSLVH